MKTREILLEASYTQMLDLKEWRRIYSIVASTNFGGISVGFDLKVKALKDDLAWAKKNYKRDDRIVWFMRLKIFHAMANPFDNMSRFLDDKLSPEDLNEINKLLSKKVNEFKSKSKEKAEYNSDTITIKYDDDRFGSELDHFMDHFMSLDIAGIQDYVFGKKPMREINLIISQMERDWRTTRKRFIQDDPDKRVLIDMGNFIWQDLDKASCDLEGDAMGHCGNSPSGMSTDEVIYSLREKKMIGKQLWWKPHATFIYHKKDKGLGEMKGFANEKPVAKHHKYIMELLMHKNIQSIFGGGYQPHKNFSISDLDESNKKMIADKKPQLLSLADLILLKGIDELRKAFKNDGTNSKVINDHYILLEYEDLDEMIDEIGNDTFKNYRAFLNGDDHFEYYSDHTPDKRDYELYLNAENIKKLENGWKARDTDEEFDDWFEYFNDNEELFSNGEVIESLHRAWVSAEESGAEIELWDAVKSSIEDARDNIEADFVLMHVDEENWTPDSINYVGLPMEAVYKFFTSGDYLDYKESSDINTMMDLSDVFTEFLEDHDIKIKLDIPNDGFQGFDDKYFNEIALEDADL